MIEMTEKEWLNGDDPFEMVRFLHRRMSARKFLLLASACFRMLEGRPRDEVERRVVEMVERYAEGMLSRTEMTRLQKEAWEAEGRARELFSDGLGSTGHFWSDDFGQMHAGWQTTAQLINLLLARKPGRPSRQTIAALQAHRECLPASIRDAVGNPFQPSMMLSSPPWITGTVRKLAEGIYNSGDFSCMPILADALEEANCEDDAILGHCRHEEQHWRGCWVLDLLLEKKRTYED